jgi:ABC-type phosphate transport system substrate-binding protein
VAVLLATTFVAPAYAITPLYSGGGTLAEKVYRDIMNCYGNHSGGDTTANLAAPPATCNLATPYNNGVELLYAGVGSGNGLTSYDTDDASHLTDIPSGSTSKKADNPPVPSTSDFGPFYGTGTGASWVPNGDDSGPFFPKMSFAGSDDPLGASNITAYNTNKNGWGAPIQFPGVIAAVALPYSPSTVDTWREAGVKPTGGSSNLDLSTNTWCGIFTGAITDWSDSEIKADNNGRALVGGPANGNTHPITVVYRSDGSGTTFLESNALIHQCNDTDHPSTHPIPAEWLSASGNSANAGNTKFFLNVAAGPGLPSNFVGQSGSKALRDFVHNNNGSISYVSPDFVLPVDTGATTVKSANMQTWASFVAGGKKWVAPTATTAADIMVGVAPPSAHKASCPIGTGFGQSPDGRCSHNALNWGVTQPKPASKGAWPAGGFTFIDMYTCYHDAGDVDALVGTASGSEGYFPWYYGTSAVNGGLPGNSLASNGFAPVPGNWKTAIISLLTSDLQTKVSTPRTRRTGCLGVKGTGA